MICFLRNMQHFRLSSIYSSIGIEGNKLMMVKWAEGNLMLLSQNKILLSFSRYISVRR